MLEGTSRSEPPPSDQQQAEECDKSQESAGEQQSQSQLHSELLHTEELLHTTEVQDTEEQLYLVHSEEESSAPQRCREVPGGGHHINLSWSQHSLGQPSTSTSNPWYPPENVSDSWVFEAEHSTYRQQEPQASWLQIPPTYSGYSDSPSSHNLSRRQSPGRFSSSLSVHSVTSPHSITPLTSREREPLPPPEVDPYHSAPVREQRDDRSPLRSWFDLVYWTVYVHTCLQGWGRRRGMTSVLGSRRHVSSDSGKPYVINNRQKNFTSFSFCITRVASVLV